MSNQILDSLEGYLDNIAAAATQTAANGGPLAELAASLEVSVDTVARKQLEIKRLIEHINVLRKKGGTVTTEVTGTGGKNFRRASIVKRLAEQRRTNTTNATLIQGKTEK